MRPYGLLIVLVVTLLSGLGLNRTATARSSSAPAAAWFPPATAQPSSQPRRLVQIDGNTRIDVKAVYGTSHALLIGINRYPHLPPTLQLRYAVHDVEELKATLICSYGFEAANITMLTEAQATRADILRALAHLANKQGVKPNDRILVFFSGHDDHPIVNVTWDDAMPTANGQAGICRPKRNGKRRREA